jgi:hypothetical protein
MTCTTLFPIQPFIQYFQQTLITLDLSDSQIDPQGAKHLANALQKNKVTRLALIYFHSNTHSLFLKDTDYT